MTLTVKNSPDIFTLALGTYGTLDEAVKLCDDNALTFNSAIKPGEVIIYDSTLVIPIQKASVVLPVQATLYANLNFTSVYGQNQFDIAINTYGTIDQYIKMLVDNNVDNDYIPSGKMYTFSLPLITDVNIYNETTAKGVIFSTGTPGIVGTPGGDFNSDFNSDFSGD
jgi:hypothetical protein